MGAVNGAVLLLVLTGLVLAWVHQLQTTPTYDELDDERTPR